MYIYIYIYTLGNNAISCLEHYCSSFASQYFCHVRKQNVHGCVTWTGLHTYTHISACILRAHCDFSDVQQ